MYFNYSRHILEIYGMFATALQIENQDLYPKRLVLAEDKKNELLKFLK